jgi:hypothetical protein
MKTCFFHIFMRFSPTKHRIRAAAILPDSPAQGLSIHVSGMNFGQFSVFLGLTLPSSLLHRTDHFRPTRWPNTPPVDSTSFSSTGCSLPANTTTRLSDTLDTNLDSSRPPLKSFSRHQPRYPNVTRTFVYISTISHPITSKHSATECSSST